MAADRKRVSIHRSKGMKGKGGAAKLFVPGAKKRRRKQVAGPLSSQRPAKENALTGGQDTSVSREINQDFKQVLRTKHMEREAPIGGRHVATTSPAAHNLNQKTRTLSNLRTKSNFKRKRFRK